MHKVLHTIPDLHVGGVAKLLLKFLDTWKNEKFEHHLCYFGENENLLSEFLKRKVIIHKIPNPGSSGFFTTYKLFRRLVRTQKFDLIHSNLFLDRMIVGLSLVMVKVPVVVSLHTTNAASDHFSVKNKMFLYLEDLVGRFTVDGYIAVSETVKKAAVDSRFVNESKVVVIPSGVSLPPVVKKELQSKQSIKLIAVGRLVETKGFQDLLQALKLLVEKKQHISLLVVGEGPRRKYLENLANDLQVSHRVNFMGYSSRVSDFLYESDIFVSCSTEEGFGLSVVEAMAHSLPVVAYDIPIFREISGRGNALSLVTKGAIKDFAEKIEDLIHDKEKYGSLSQKSYKRVQDEYQIEICAHKYLEYYSRLIEQKNGK